MVIASEHQVDARDYPRPQLRREPWRRLDGLWEFAARPGRDVAGSDCGHWRGSIRVPFAPETAASGIAHVATCGTAGTAVRWTHGTRMVAASSSISAPSTTEPRYGSTVCWLQPTKAATRPSSADITDLGGGQPVTIVVRAEDDPPTWPSRAASRIGSSSRTRSGIRAPPASGRPCGWRRPRDAASHDCAGRRASSDWEIDSTCALAGSRRPTACSSHVTLTRRRPPARRRHVRASSADELSRRIALLRSRHRRLPQRTAVEPRARRTLIDAELELLVDDGRRSIDRRRQLHRAAVGVASGRPLRPQRPPVLPAYGARSGLLARDRATAPDDEALRRDVELAKAMGFNGVRKHQKIEDPRICTGPTVSGCWSGRRCPAPTDSRRTSVRAPHAGVDRGDRARPQPSLHRRVGARSTNRGACRTCPTVAAQRHYVQALYHLTQDAGPHRPVIGNDGWESVATDIIGIHDYDPNPERIARTLLLATTWFRACSARSARAARTHAGGTHELEPSDCAHRVRRHRVFRRPDAHGATRAATTARLSSRRIRSCCRPCSSRASSPGSATRSLPIPTRRPTDCFARTGPRSSR